MICVSSLDLRPTIVRDELGTLENLNHFCRFVLKCGVKAGENRSGPEFNARTLTGSQIRDDIASRDDSGQHRELGWDLFVWLRELGFGYFDKNPAI